MSLAAGSNKIQYTVTSAEDEFIYPYSYWEAGEISVFVTDLTTGIETELVQELADFTLAPTNGDTTNGALVTTAIEYGNHRVTITRTVDVESEAAFLSGDGLPPDALNSEFDKMAARQQQLEEGQLLSIRVPATDPPGLTYQLLGADLRAGKALIFDSEGNVGLGTIVTQGQLVINSSAGLDETGSVVSVKASNFFEFDISGNLDLADGTIPLFKLLDMTQGQYVGRGYAAGTGAPTALDVVPDLLLDDDTMADDAADRGATQQSIKAYTDNTLAAYDAARPFDLVGFYVRTNPITQTTTSQIPRDNTTPLISEGAGMFGTNNITAKSLNSVFEIEFYGHLWLASAGQQLTVAFFEDSTCIGVGVYEQMEASNYGTPTIFKIMHTPSDLLEHNYTARFGPATAITATLNNTGDTYGGAKDEAYLTIKEWSNIYS